jgi:hypothetical protein
MISVMVLVHLTKTTRFITDRRKQYMILINLRRTIIIR